MSHYLITGGCGFIGSHLADLLLERGHKVRVLDNLSTGKRENLSPAAELILGDVGDRAAVTQALLGVEGCFHLAAVASVAQCNRDWLGTHRTNLTGAITLFDCARVTGAQSAIPIVYASSAAVYGCMPASRPWCMACPPSACASSMSMVRGRIRGRPIRGSSRSSASG
jgi:UDP-glucose 4-epimerase